MLDIEKYFPDQCFKCFNNSFVIQPQEVIVQKTKILDFPHVKCKKCGTSYLVSDLLEEVERALNSLAEKPQETLFEGLSINTQNLEAEKEG